MGWISLPFFLLFTVTNVNITVGRSGGGHGGHGGGGHSSGGHISSGHFGTGHTGGFSHSALSSFGHPSSYFSTPSHSSQMPSFFGRLSSSSLSSSLQGYGHGAFHPVASHGSPGFRPIVTRPLISRPLTMKPLAVHPLIALPMGTRPLMSSPFKAYAYPMTGNGVAGLSPMILSRQPLVATSYPYLGANYYWRTNIINFGDYGEPQNFLPTGYYQPVPWLYHGDAVNSNNGSYTGAQWPLLTYENTTALSDSPSTDEHQISATELRNATWSTTDMKWIVPMKNFPMETNLTQNSTMGADLMKNTTMMRPSSMTNLTMVANSMIKSTSVANLMKNSTTVRNPMANSTSVVNLTKNSPTVANLMKKST